MHPVPLALAHARNMAQPSNVLLSKNEHAMFLTTMAVRCSLLKTGAKMMVGCVYRHIQNIDKNYTEHPINKIEISMTPLLHNIRPEMVRTQHVVQEIERM